LQYVKLLLVCKQAKAHSLHQGKALMVVLCTSKEEYACFLIFVENVEISRRLVL